MKMKIYVVLILMLRPGRPVLKLAKGRIMLRQHLDISGTNHMFLTGNASVETIQQLLVAAAALLNVTTMINLV